MQLRTRSTSHQLSKKSVSLNHCWLSDQGCEICWNAEKTFSWSPPVMPLSFLCGSLVPLTISWIFLRCHDECILWELQASFWWKRWQLLGSATRATDSSGGRLLLCCGHPPAVTQWFYCTEGGECKYVLFFVFNTWTLSSLHRYVFYPWFCDWQESSRSCSYNCGNTVIRLQHLRISDQLLVQFAVPSFQVQLNSRGISHIAT